MKRIGVVLSMLIVMSVAGAAFAAECEGVKYPDATTLDGQKLVLNGLGIREATTLQLDVYVAALYLPAKQADGVKAAGADVAKRLDLHFVREVEKEKIVGAWNEGFEKNAGGQLAAMKERIAKLNSWMSSIKAGEKYSFTYLPGKGLEVKVKGSIKGTIEGADFMKAFFLIWLGPNPPNPGLRVGLLGGKCE